MDFCFVFNLQIDSIFDTFHFMAIQRGVKFLLPMTVYTCYNEDEDDSHCIHSKNRDLFWNRIQAH